MERKGRIPEWLTLGRTVLLLKMKGLSSENDYRPITCLITSYKIFTGMIRNCIKEHAIRNDIWDKNQMGTCEGYSGQ